MLYPIEIIFKLYVMYSVIFLLDSLLIFLSLGFASNPGTGGEFILSLNIF